MTNLKFPHRRQFLHLAAGAAALPLVSRVAWAQAYPSRPVRIIVGYPPGGPIDIVARLVGQSLSERLGQQFVIENRAGAGGNVGAEAVVRAPADGYTLLLVGSNNYINATLYQNLNFNFIRDIASVGSIGRTPLVMEVNPSVPAKTVPEFIAYAKANPGKLNMASGGNGTPVHMAGELFKMMAGIDMAHVPYRGSAPALTDLIGGQVQVMFDAVSSSIQHIRAGKLRPLAATTSGRLQVLPDLPTVRDFLPGYEASSVQGIGVPKNTPAEIVDKLHGGLTAALSDPKVKARFAELGIELLTLAPADFGKLIVDETEKWSKVVKFAGLKPE
jgi:tripartite-type tricarboxylate transporter receptor subunit TctC